MTSLPSILPASKARSPLLIGIGASVILLVVAIVAPRAVLHGWLIAFAAVGGIPPGAFAWLAIHRLSGGRWGELAHPALARAASALPLLIPALLPIMLGSRLVYPWAAYPASAGPGVAAIYLNPLAFALRSLVGLLGLSLGARLARQGRLSQLTAGLALVFYAVFMNFTAFDWLLSLDPRFTSSAFGAQIIVQQLLSAMAFTALIQQAPADHRGWGDIGALLLATTLGQAYLLLMTFIVLWYGDLPGQAEWYLRRSAHGWVWLEAFGVVFSLVVPLLALLFARIRDRANPLRLVGGCLLLGVFIEDVWLVSPATEAWSGLVAVVAAVAMAGLAFGLTPSMTRWMGGAGHEP
jgi:hypothetical protein